MRDNSRLILRSFIAVGLCWLCFAPGITIHSSFLIISAIVAFAAAIALISKRAPGFILLFFTAAIGSMLWATRGFWIFPPAFSGLLITLLIFLIYTLGNNEKPTNSTPLPAPPVCAPQMARLTIFHSIWFAGLILIGLFPCSYSAITFMAWTCLLLVLGRNLWMFCIHTEWYGYMMRREVFVPKISWNFRFIRLAILGIICISLIVLCFL